MKNKHRNSRFTRVNGSFTSGDRHVGGVRYESCTLHDGLGYTVDLNGELGEVPQYLRHLVTTLTATDVNNYLGVRILRERLRNDGLAATESSGNGSGAALDAALRQIEFIIKSLSLNLMFVSI